MRSDAVKTGSQQAPHRSLFNALGLTKEEMERPLVGIVSSYNEIVPGHMNLDKVVAAVKQGVAMAGGTPIVFPAIAVCDGIAMGHVGMKYSLVTRDLIADSTEAMAMAHQFDALVMVPNCDKNVPGLLMAAARINVPTVFVSGGPMMAGHIHGHKTSLSSMFEAVGSYAAGKISEEELTEKVVIDMELPFAAITEQFIEELEYMEPFGKGNTKPVFAARGVVMQHVKIIGKNKNVAKATAIDAAGNRMEAICFHDAQEFAERCERNNGKMSITFYPGINEFRGERQIQIVITHYR